MSVESTEGLIADRSSEKVSGRVDDDLELGLRTRSQRTGNSHYRFWRHPQFKKFLVYSTMSCLILLILFTVTAFILYEILEVYGPPYFTVRGKLSGDAIADLGTVGLITIKPQLGLDIRVTL